MAWRVGLGLRRVGRVAAFASFAGRPRQRERARGLAPGTSRGGGRATDAEGHRRAGDDRRDGAVRRAVSRDRSQLPGVGGGYLGSGAAHGLARAGAAIAMSVKLDHGSDELEENHEINVTPMDLNLHRSFPSLVVVLVVSPCRVRQAPCRSFVFLRHVTAPPHLYCAKEVSHRLSGPDQSSGRFDSKIRVAQEVRLLRRGNNARLDQPKAPEARVTFAADHQMVVDRDAQRLGRRLDLARHLDVVA
jgi:hypothetical protein